MNEAVQVSCSGSVFCDLGEAHGRESAAGRGRTVGQCTSPGARCAREPVHPRDRPSHLVPHDAEKRAPGTRAARGLPARTGSESAGTGQTRYRTLRPKTFPCRRQRRRASAGIDGLGAHQPTASTTAPCARQGALILPVPAPMSATARGGGRWRGRRERACCGESAGSPAAGRSTTSPRDRVDVAAARRLVRGRRGRTEAYAPPSEGVASRGPDRWYRILVCGHLVMTVASSPEALTGRAPQSALRCRRGARARADRAAPGR